MCLRLQNVDLWKDKISYNKHHIVPVQERISQILNKQLHVSNLIFRPL